MQEPDESLIASIFGIAFSVLLIEQISFVVDTVFKQDISYFVKNAKEALIPILDLANHHPVSQNIIFPILISRLRK